MRGVGAGARGVCYGGTDRVGSEILKLAGTGKNRD